MPGSLTDWLEEFVTHAPNCGKWGSFLCKKGPQMRAAGLSARRARGPKFVSSDGWERTPRSNESKPGSDVGSYR